MPTPFRRSSRQMGSAHILDLCLYSFPSLSSIQIRRTFLLSAVLPSIICSSNQSVGSIPLDIVVSIKGITLPFASCCMFCSNILSFSSYDSSLWRQHVFFQSYIFSCVLFRGTTSSFRRSIYFKNGMMELLNTYHILSRDRWRLRKVYWSCEKYEAVGGTSWCVAYSLPTILCQAGNRQMCKTRRSVISDRVLEIKIITTYYMYIVL